MGVDEINESGKLLKAPEPEAVKAGLESGAIDGPGGGSDAAGEIASEAGVVEVGALAGDASGLSGDMSEISREKSAEASASGEVGQENGADSPGEHGLAGQLDSANGLEPDGEIAQEGEFGAAHDGGLAIAQEGGLEAAHDGGLEIDEAGGLEGGSAPETIVKPASKPGNGRAVDDFASLSAIGSDAPEADVSGAGGFGDVGLIGGAPGFVDGGSLDGPGGVKAEGGLGGAGSVESGFLGDGTIGLEPEGERLGGAGLDWSEDDWSGEAGPAKADFEAAEADGASPRPQAVAKPDLKIILEGLIFVSDEPLSLERLKEAFDEELPDGAVEAALEEMAADWERMGRAFAPKKVAGGWQFRSRPNVAPYAVRLKGRAPAKLSKAAMETLAVIAYRQPVLRAEVEKIRGVDAGGVLKNLMEKNLVRISGRRETLPGRPMLYSTTVKFLETFDLPDLKSLPTIDEIERLCPPLYPPRNRLF